MILELRVALPELLSSRKLLKEKRKLLMSLFTINRCLNSKKAKPMVVLRLSKQLKLKSDGCKNYGNILKNVKTDLMTILN